jgi:hypothetical protein
LPDETGNCQLLGGRDLRRFLQRLVAKAPAAQKWQKQVRLAVSGLGRLSLEDEMA